MTVQQLAAMLAGLEDRTLVVTLPDGHFPVNGVTISDKGSACLTLESN